MDLREVRESLDQRHPWERARARFFGDFIAAHPDLKAQISVLDIGAGDGFFAHNLLPLLKSGSRIVCFDPNYSQEDLDRLRASAPQGLTYTAERPIGEFDLLLLLDVVEHVPDDGAFLSDWVHQAMKAGGRALVSVPAFMSLFTAHDIALGHHRRYRLSQLTRLFSRCGLDVEASGGVFHSLLVPRLLSKLLERIKGIRSCPRPEQIPTRAETEVGAWNGNSALTACVDLALRVDNGLSFAFYSAGIAVPGLSAWALGRKA